MNSAQIATLRQTRQAATYSGLKKLSKALSDAKYGPQKANHAVRFEENRIKVPKYKQVTTYSTAIVKTAQPVYEDRPIDQTIVTATKAIKAFTGLGEAGIAEGDSFTVQIGSGEPATVTFGADRQITVAIGGDLQSFGYGPGEGDLAGGLGVALGSIAGLTASYDEDGQLKLETDDAEPLVLGDGAGSALGALGLVAGTTTSSVGTVKVQVGTEMVQTGTKQVAISNDYIRDGETEIVAGIRAVRDKTNSGDAPLTTSSRKQIIEASLALDAAIGPKELAKGVENPFTGLRGRVNLDKLKKASTQSDLGFSAMQIAVALKAYGANPTGVK